MESIISKELYELLWNRINNSYQLVDIDSISVRKLAILVFNNGENAVKRIICKMKAHNDAFSFVLISQACMKAKLEEMFGSECTIVEWNGNYNISLLDKLKLLKDFNEIDGFLFFSSQEIIQREMNIYEIGYEWNKINSCKIYSCIYDQNICHYTNIADLYLGLRLYSDIENMLERFMNYL